MGVWVEERRGTTRQRIVDAAWEVAHERGLAELTMREVAARVGMRAPSLYVHFDSKHAIYDAMYGGAWQAYLDLVDRVELPAHPRAALRVIARTFVDFATADLPRHQLMNLSTIPGFTPSAESYAVAVAVYDRFVAWAADAGLRPSPADLDLFTALVSGIVAQQWANDPGGTRWTDLVDRAMDMYADHLDLPKEPT